MLRLQVFKLKEGDSLKSRLNLNSHITMSVENKGRRITIHFLVIGALLLIVVCHWTWSANTHCSLHWCDLNIRSIECKVTCLFCALISNIIVHAIDSATATIVIRCALFCSNNNKKNWTLHYASRSRFNLRLMFIYCHSGHVYRVCWHIKSQYFDNLIATFRLFPLHLWSFFVNVQIESNNFFQLDLILWNIGW